jgi:hypothetical protein
MVHVYALIPSIILCVTGGIRPYAPVSSTWHDTFSILLARGRAQVSVAASRGDWPKRTQDQAYSDQNHASAA